MKNVVYIDDVSKDFFNIFNGNITFILFMLLLIPLIVVALYSKEKRNLIKGQEIPTFKDFLKKNIIYILGSFILISVLQLTDVKLFISMCGDYATVKSGQYLTEEGRLIFIEEGVKERVSRQRFISV